MNYVLLNGELIKNDKGLVAADDHSYRYGDGIFETMKVANGEILFKRYHFERLFKGLGTLNFTVPGSFVQQRLEEQVKVLCQKNNCERSARVRLSVSRGSGGIYDCDNELSYLIECRPLEHKGFNENGLVIDVFPDARKSIDKFSNLKSANYLPYVMAAIWAKENKLNEALIVNSNERICEATIANVFWVKNGRIFTPPLSEGCVAGIMRAVILNYQSQISDFGIAESALSEKELADADEVFLTNVISGIRWVGQFRNKKYTNNIAGKIFAGISQANPASTSINT